MRAGVAHRGAAVADADRAYRDAEAALAACDMANFARVAALARGELIGGADGAALVATAEAGLAAQAVVDVGRWTRMILPRP